MRTYIKFNSDDNQHSEWKKGELGYIEGFVRGGNDVPLVAVVIEKRKTIVLAPNHTLEVINPT